MGSVSPVASYLDPEWMSALRAVCIATGFALHVVPLVTMRQVWSAGTTLNFHISTYAFALLNQSVNLWYAVIRHDPALTAHRFFGVVFNTFYVWTFLQYCPPGRSADFRRTLARAAALFAFVVVDLQLLLPLLGYGGSTGPTYFSHIAFFGAMTGIGLAAGPLATVVRGRVGRGSGGGGQRGGTAATALLAHAITAHCACPSSSPLPPLRAPLSPQGEVLRTKDASSLPLPFLAMVTLQCIAWTYYGYLQVRAREGGGRRRALVMARDVRPLSPNRSRPSCSCSAGGPVDVRQQPGGRGAGRPAAGADLDVPVQAAGVGRGRQEARAVRQRRRPCHVAHRWRCRRRQPGRGKRGGR